MRFDPGYWHLHDYLLRLVRSLPGYDSVVAGAAPG